MWTDEDAAVAAAYRVDVDLWRSGFDEVLDRIAPRFGRCEPLRNAGALMLGLVSDIGRKNCWTLAERCGHASPDRMQHLLSRAKWDADGVRDDLRAYVVDHLGDDDAILIVDETGDLKKGTHTVGVQRQYTGTAGRIENAQVAVYLAYAGSTGHALVDRELYLPQAWIDDPERRERGGVPADVEFATKPELATRMITRAVAAGIPARWATGDEVYGADPDLRAGIATLGLGYVLAVGSNRTVTTSAGTVRVDQLTRSLPRRAWQRRQRRHRHQGTTLVLVGAGRDHRRSRPASITCWRAATTRPVNWPITAATARIRSPWSTTCVSPGGAGKSRNPSRPARDLAGLDEHQVRTWTSWHRWVTLAMLAHAFLVVTTAAQRRPNKSTTTPRTR